jgi:hypothetical protein
MNRAFVVLGMHRSGTSAITRTLNLLGLFLPGHQMLAPKADNPLGYWEHAGIMQAHEEFFTRLGYRHYGPIGPWNDDVWQSEWVAPLEAALIEILQRDYLPHKHWITKDPRTCRMLPVWLSVLERLDTEPSFLLMTRNPVEVAASLRARENLPEDFGHWLWLGHVLESEFLTRGRPRVFVTYEELLRDWSCVVARVADRLRIELAVTGAASTRITAFLKTALRHHSLAAASADEASLPKRLSSQIWQSLNDPQAADEAWLKVQCDRVREQWRESFTSPLGRSLSSIVEQCYGRSIDCQQEASAAVIASLASARQLQSVLRSRSWRLTAPLRVIHAHAQKTQSLVDAGAAVERLGSSSR